MRIPISRLRCEAEYAITPYSPTTPSSSAMPAAAPSITSVNDVRAIDRE